MNVCGMLILEYAVLRLLRLALLALPVRVVSDIGAGLGCIAERIGIRRRVAIDNVLQSDLGLSPAQAKRLIRRCYRHMGRTLTELLVLDRMPPAWATLTIDPGFHRLAGRGAVVVAAHLGNWEFLAKVLIASGVRLAVVVHRQANPHVDRLINTIRRRAGFVIVHDDDVPSMVRCLSDGMTLGLVADQDFGDNSVPCVLLGRACLAPRGPEFFSSRWHIPVFTAHGVRVDRYRHAFRLEALDTAELSDGDGAITRQYTRTMETWVRQTPDQWFWQHRRWKNPA